MAGDRNSPSFGYRGHVGYRSFEKRSSHLVCIPAFNLHDCAIVRLPARFLAYPAYLPDPCSLGTLYPAPPHPEPFLSCRNLDPPRGHIHFVCGELYRHHIAGYLFHRQKKKSEPDRSVSCCHFGALHRDRGYPGQVLLGEDRVGMEYYCVSLPAACDRRPDFHALTNPKKFYSSKISSHLINKI